MAVAWVVKLAPELPLDGLFPYSHLDRKFMHLGFHIYDVGFQSPNVEAAKPMVYTTTIFLLLIVVGIGLTAPPIGLNVFVVSAIARSVPIAQTYRGVLPFITADIVRLVLVFLFPGLALGLVHLLS